ncbi:gamma-gliadin-like isoform X1 [Nasonia vitripennis]|uniref:Uncharacterized protein n=1 Tax=Nasonia vitripennis TaxID=7425 RepID=A0A7M7G9I0_NASVI|nr:gamma-gliadin-like isoform X1 [Nasonia vitripennis]
MWYFIVGCFLVSACTGESLYADIADNLRVKRQNQHQQQPQQAPIENYNYRPYNQAPDRIKQLLQLQAYREPLVHIPAHAPPQLQAAPAAPQHQQQQQHVPQVRPTQYNPKVQYGQAPEQPTYKGIQPAAQGPPQYKTQYNPQYQQPQPQPNALYRPEAAGPPAGLGAYQGQPQQQPQGQYPKNLPPHIQKIIDSQRAYQG